ncbi:PAS domain S-box-containing protein [Planomicrobium koreense]|uniref:PAS domain S-box-containing protein n=1 Tax=Planococcus koreensis TaxID=112331 RepID=A0A7W8CUG6_9BACL|nr:SpoIIE family protein phosphatase [Planococcus koreensis]MBB5180200.1 PAS domain S-box-containing protein [Planococcus koreensis]
MTAANRLIQISIAVSILFYLTIFIDERVGFSDFSDPAFLMTHVVLEMTSIFIAISIAVQGWLFTRIGDNYKQLIFSSLFFAVGIFDILHILTVAGMPGSLMVEPSVTGWFWSVARITETILFIILMVELDSPLKLRGLKSMAAVLSIFYVTSISIFILLLQSELPMLVVDRRPTLLFNAGMALSTIVHLGILLYLLSLEKKGKTNSIEVGFIAPASIFLLFSTLVYSFTAITDWSATVSHVFKVAGYGFLFVLIFVRYGQRPFKEVEEISNTYERFLNSVGEGIYGIDFQGKVTFVNDSAVEMLGFRRDELVGRSSHPIIHHTKTDGSPYFMEECPICLAVETNDYSFVTDEVFWRKDGTNFPVEYFTQPLVSEGAAGTMVTFKDVTESEKLKRLEIQHQNIQYEVALAVTVQEALLKSTNTVPMAFDTGVVSIPFKELNGDFYTLVPDEEGVFVSIADVSGKGIPAAIQMTMMKFAMDQKESPQTVLARINKFSAHYMEQASFITMFCSYIDLASKTLHYASGGHEPVLVYQPAEKRFRELNPTGPVLGISEGLKFKSDSIQLAAGDLVVLFTDGLVERKKHTEDTNRLLREAVLRADLSLDAATLAQEIFAQVNALEPYAIEDDQTLIILKI